MRFGFLFIFQFFLYDFAAAQDSSSISSLKDKVNSFRTSYPSSDLLPPEFNSSALEIEYYCEIDDSVMPMVDRNVFVLKLRDNCTFFYETYYKPYNWARIEFAIGTYSISGDTIHLAAQPLLERQPDKDYIHLPPTIAIPWMPPGLPQYLLVDKTGLTEPAYHRRTFYTLNDKPDFDLGSCK